MKNLILLLAVFIVVSSPVLGQAAPSTARLFVKHSDGKVVDLVTGAFNDELNLLKEVTVIKNGSEYTLAIMMMTIPDAAETRYAVSVEMLQHLKSHDGELVSVAISNFVDIMHADRVQEFAAKIVSRFRKAVEVRTTFLRQRSGS
jgi:hypothetical protein